jgi:hypothetical protein
MWKILIVILFILSAGLMINLSGYGNKLISTPREIQNLLDSADTISSFRTLSREFSETGEELTSTEVVFKDKNWAMKIIDGDKLSSDWRIIGQDAYILDTNDGYFWKMAYTEEIVPPAKTDIRKNLKELKEKISKKSVVMKDFGSEPCDGKVCLRYQVQSITDRQVDWFWYLWIDKSNNQVVKEQYLMANGRTAILSYSDYSASEVLTPVPVKNAPAGSDPLTLPGNYYWHEKNPDGKNTFTPKWLRLN